MDSNSVNLEMALVQWPLTFCSRVSPHLSVFLEELGTKDDLIYHNDEISTPSLAVRKRQSQLATVFCCIVSKQSE